MKSLHACILSPQYLLPIIVKVISDTNIRRHLFIQYNLYRSQRIYFLGNLCTGIIFNVSLVDKVF